MFVNTRKPYIFRSFSFNHPQGAIWRYYNVFRWFAFVDYLFGMWPYVYIICLSVCAWCSCQFTNTSSTDKSTKHTHTHTHTQIDDIHIRPHAKQILNEGISAEDIVVTAYGPLRMVEW